MDRQDGRLDERRLHSQAMLCIDALALALDGALNRGIPADKTLASLFRSERKMGSRDRSLISMNVFAVFRWWGWIRQLAVGSPARPESTACAKLLLAALATESQVLPPIATALASRLELSSKALAGSVSSSSPAARAAKTIALLGEPVKDPLESCRLIPEWSLGELPEAAGGQKLFDWLQTRPPIWLRAQTPNVDGLCESLRKAGLNPVRHPVMERAVKLLDVKANLHSLKEFNDGLFEIQDISSQCIGQACMPKAGEMWWDVCAGGGGKSLQLADLLHRKGSVRATDTRAYKLEDLKKRAARAAFPNIRCAPWDGSAPDSKRKAVFDGVLVDSPCSSSGRWRRNPDARWIAKSHWVDELCETQFKIMNAAAAGVKPGGVLIYATCSFFTREDSGNVERFLKTHPEFSLEGFPNPLTGEMTAGTLLTLPWDADCDASFVARFRKA